MHVIFDSWGRVKVWSNLKPSIGDETVPYLFYHILPYFVLLIPWRWNSGYWKRAYSNSSSAQAASKLFAAVYIDLLFLRYSSEIHNCISRNSLRLEYETLGNAYCKFIQSNWNHHQSYRSDDPPLRLSWIITEMMIYDCHRIATCSTMKLPCILYEWHISEGCFLGYGL